MTGREAVGRLTGPRSWLPLSRWPVPTGQTSPKICWRVVEPHLAIAQRLHRGETQIIEATGWLEAARGRHLP
jgi:hypothetical protein